MGYRVKFESGESVIFDNEPSIQDIEEAEKSFRAQKSTSLVDKIPDTAPDNSVPSKYVKGTENDLFPKYKTPPSLGEATQDVLDEFIAIPDAAAGVGTALTSGMAGGLLGFYGIADQSSDVNERMSEGARKFSWQPRTEIGQEITQKILEPTMKVLEPLLGLGSSFAVTPMKPFGKGKVLPKVEPKIEPTIKSNITSTLEQENKKVLTRQLKDIQKREAEIQASLVDGTATPELQKEAEALYKKRIELEQTLFPEKSVEKPIDNKETAIQNLQDTRIKLDKIHRHILELDRRGQEVPEDLITLYDELHIKLDEQQKALGDALKVVSVDDRFKGTSPWDIAQLKIEQAGNNPALAGIYKREAIEKLNGISDRQARSSLVEALEKEIQAYDKIIEANKVPLERTERPLEGTIEPEVIPEPSQAKEVPYTKAIDDIMAGFTKERNTSTDNAKVMYDWDIINRNHIENQKLAKKQLEAEARAKAHADAEEAKKLSFESNEPPPRKNTFVTREQALAYMDQKIESITKEIQRVQNAINWAKKNNKTEIPFDKGTVSHEDLLLYRDKLQKELDKTRQDKMKPFGNDIPDHILPKTEAELDEILKQTETPNTGKALYTPESILRRLNGVIKHYENILEKLRTNIHNRESGAEPSGTPVFRLGDKEYGLEAAKGLEEALTDQYQRYLNNRDKIQKAEALRKQESQPKTKTEPSLELPTIDSTALDNVSTKRKYDSIDELLMDYGKNPIDGFIDNPQLFTKTENNNVKVANDILESHPEISRTVDILIDKVGLEKDNIYIVQGERTKVKFYGNSAVITLNLSDIPKMIQTYSNDIGGKTGHFNKFIKGSSEKAIYHYVIAKQLAHEIGHIVFTKWLQLSEISKTDMDKLILGFEKWKKSNNIDPVTFLNTKDISNYEKYHSVFDEYFAEQTVNALLHDSLLSSFHDKRFSLAKQIRQLISNTAEYLRNVGVKLNINPYREDIINNIISRNQQEIKKSGRTLWERLETERNDKLLFDHPDIFPFANKTLAEIRNNPYEVHRLTKDGLNTDVIPWQREVYDSVGHMDIANFSNKALIAIGNSAPYFARKLFGKTTLAQIFKDNPAILETSRRIREGEYRAAVATNSMWFGDVQRHHWDNAPILQKFSKIKLPDSPYMVHKNLTELEAYNIHQVFREGLENGLDYGAAIQTYGQHLTPKEQHALLVFGDMFKKQYHYIASLEKSLGKKNRIAFKDGWYPSVRNGDFFITVHSNGNMIYREHFETKAAAEAWRDAHQNQIPQHMTLGEIGNMKDNPQHPGMYGLIDAFIKFMDNKYHIDVSKEGTDFKYKLATKGGVFGQHHQRRTNIIGYKGSELGKTPEELGRSFKEAIIRNNDEFESLYKTMYIKHHVDSALNASSNLLPQERVAIQQMRDSALNVVPNSFEAFDKAAFEITDRMARAFHRSLYPTETFKPNQALLRTIQNNLTGLFYLFKVLPSLSMFVGQLLSPLQAIRHAAYDGGLKSIGNFGKGIYNLVTKDPELMESLFYATQMSDVIEPQFVKALHLQGNNKVVEWLKDWVLFRKPQEAADVLSRVITYAYMHTHYKNIYPSLSMDKIASLAREGVDATMGAYSRGETAPIFKHTGGIIGESMRPLQTYGQMVVGNMVADFKHMVTNPTNLKAYAPFIMSGIISTVLGGALNGPIMTQYETTRKLLMSMNPQWELPSMLDLISSGIIALDSVIEDPEAAIKLISYGALSSLTGIDIGASIRTTETFPGNLLTLGLAMVDTADVAYDASKAVSRLVPPYSSAVDMTFGALTLGKTAMGGSTTDAELKRAITSVSPRGPLKNALMKATGANKTTVMGEKTNNIATGQDSKALMPEGPTENIAHWMGNLSTEERYRTDVKMKTEFKERVINNRIKRLYTLYNENPKEKYLDELIQLGATDKNIKEQLQTRAYNALIDSDIRMVTTSKGKVSNSPANVRKIQGLFKFKKAE